MTLSEDELVNAICLHMAERKGIRPESVQVELVYDEETGFSAEIQAEGRSIVWIEANMAEAVMRYMLKQYGRHAYRDDISFRLGDEILVDVR
ncbi:YxcD family protein [Paenibacillus sp. TRM 82003]|nr:YxcD family protein [Paenibacillus sp. TRM 82003]